MKKFAEFLTESSTRLTVSDFPKSIENATTGRPARPDTRFVDRLTRTLHRLNAALDAGNIINPEFVALKSDINHLLESALNEPEWLLNAVFRENRSTSGFTLHDLYGGIPYANAIPGKLKKADAAQKKAVSVGDKTFLGWQLPILRELLPLAELFMSLKDKVVKRVPKTDAEKAATKQAFIAPFVKSEVGQQIRDVLKKQTDGIKDAYVARIVKYTTAQVEKFAAMSLEEQKAARKKSYNTIGREPAALTYDVWEAQDTGYGQPRHYTLKSNYKQTLLSLAERDAKAMQDDFMYKTSKKLAAIVDAKKIPLAKDPELLGGMNRTTFEGDVQLTFADNSRFDVRNKIVIKSNRYGTVFNQFPTTFHNVVLPDGSKMPSPSEERMNTVFAKA